MKELLILSGKGGTGKTTIASSFIKLSNVKAYADCDIDAPNLHLIMNQKVEAEHEDYYGLPKARIDTKLCIRCDICRQKCRFDAINVKDKKYEVNQFGCEGCGVCEMVCSVNAINLYPAIAGDLQLYADDTVFSTAQLKMGSGNSGLLVTEVKKAMKVAGKEVDWAIIDGSPGIGCPVIASLSGADLTLIVSEPSISGISDMERIIKTAKGLGTKIAVCINKFNTNIDNSHKIEQFCIDNNIPLVGKIPYDYKAVQATNQGKTAVDVDCEAGRAIREVY
ncbi:MAG TPA: ATPase, partial [Eubacteriaceae bacterium]|nr:ATPase [Eubacteriaceae bacterium]